MPLVAVRRWATACVSATQPWVIWERFTHHVGVPSADWCAFRRVALRWEGGASAATECRDAEGRRRRQAAHSAVRPSWSVQSATV